MKAYTYNDRLVGVGNDQILGTDQGGGSTYTAGNGIDITNDVISVDNTVAMVSALPTTELGKFTIQSNVSGGPIEVIVPTDVAPVSAFYDLNAQYDDALSNRTGPSTYYYVFKSPGYVNDTWSANPGDVIQIKVKETIQGIGSLMGFYASNSTPASSSAPPINYPVSTPLIAGTGVTYVVEPGIYTTSLGANPAGSSFGKYITLMIVTGGSGYVDDILDKIEFTFGRSNSALGTTVNLSRYYLGNTVSTSTPSSDLACYVTVDGTTKQQKVYLPASLPTSYYGGITQAFEYGSNSNSPSYSNATTKQYRAYKYTSSPERYQFAYCTDWDKANKLMTFIAYDNSGNAIEKWTLDYTTYSSNVWTTTPISAGSTYTAGDFISIDNDEISVTGVGNLVAGNNITITESGNNITISSEGGGSTYTAGNYISIDNNDVIAVTGLTPVSGSDGIAVNDNVVSLDTPIEIVAGDNIEITVTGVSAIISAQGGTTYTEGNCIDITSNVISWETTAGITDIVSVSALPANPVATVIYLIPET